MPSIKDYIFNFLSTTNQTLIRRLTVKANVFTLYTHKLEKNSTMLELNGPASLFKQCNAQCTGERFKPLNQNDALHNATRLHLGEAEQERHHVHFVNCALIEPEDFNCFFDQFSTYQTSKARESITKWMINEVCSNWWHRRNYQLETGAKDCNPAIDTKTDFLSPTDVEAAKKEYEIYFSENKKEIIEQYQQIQAAFFKEIGGNAWRAIKSSGELAALHAFLVETLVAHGISKSKAEYFALALNLTIITLTSTTWYPLISAISTMAVFKLLHAENKTAMMSSIISNVAHSIAEQYPLGAYGLLTLAVSALSAIPAAKFGSFAAGWVTRSFWNKLYGANDTNQSAPSLTVDAPKKSR